MRYNLVLKLRVCLKHYEFHQSLYFKNLKFLCEIFLESRISLESWIYVPADSGQF